MVAGEPRKESLEGFTSSNRGQSPRIQGKVKNPLPFKGRGRGGVKIHLPAKALKGRQTICRTYGTLKLPHPTIGGFTPAYGLPSLTGFNFKNSKTYQLKTYHYEKEQHLGTHPQGSRCRHHSSIDGHHDHKLHGRIGSFRVVTAPPASEHLLERKNVTTAQQRGESPHSRRRTWPIPHADD